MSDLSQNASEEILTARTELENVLHMTGELLDSRFGEAVAVTPAPVDASWLVVCEHASNRVPSFMNSLGLETETLQSHIAWDPGALCVAEILASEMNAPLVAGQVSRLVYDCNRPPEAPSAMPGRSEIFDIPGNTKLTQADKEDRVAGVYQPFRDALAGEIKHRQAKLRAMVTVHSFTPVFQGKPRAVELGILHGSDDRLARAMMAAKPESVSWDVQMNEPYSLADGVAHTLDLHGAGNNLHNVMLEIRNDLIETAEQQAAWARMLTPWLAASLSIAEGF